MNSLPENLLETILAKMSLKSIVTSKLVCKQWKSILESKFFYQLYHSHHQNSHSLWSLMCRVSQKEVMAHYGCNNCSLTRSLGSYISSFKTSLFPEKFVSVMDFSDIGLMLIGMNKPDARYRTYYVANPISREYLEIPPLIPCINLRTTFTTSRLVTQVENEVVLSYKIVLIKYIRTKIFADDICLLMYSSETGLWSFNTIKSPLCFWIDHPISLNGNLYWTGFNYTLGKHELLYHNFYATHMESDRCRVIPFPDKGKHSTFRRVCATSQGSLMYMKIASKDKDDGSFEHNLSVWKLKDNEWQIVSEISLDIGFDHFDFIINPFDAKTVYFWSMEKKSVASINLDICKNGDICKVGFHNNFECSSDDCIHKISEGKYLSASLYDSQVHMVFFPRWLYRIPCPPRA